MNPKARLILFLLGVVGLATLYAVCSVRLPAPDGLRDRYRAAVNARTVTERNCTDAVSAVNFDFRGFDTLGEEFILFISVIGATVLLRRPDDNHGPLLPDALPRTRAVPPSDVMRGWIFGTVGPKVLLGLYIVTHGQLTPGGGFQGGVVLATAALVLYLGEGLPFFRRVVPHTLVEMAEAVGAAGYIVVGLLAFAVGREFLTNIFPIGTRGEVTSAGTIPWISATTGLEVAAGFTLLLFAFLQELLVPEEDA